MFRALRARPCSRYSAPSGTRLRRSPRFDQACLRLQRPLLSTSRTALPLPPRVESRRRNKSRPFPSRKPRFVSESLPSLGRPLTRCQKSRGSSRAARLCALFGGSARRHLSADFHGWEWRKYGKFQKNIFSRCFALWRRSARAKRAFCRQGGVGRGEKAGSSGKQPKTGGEGTRAHGHAGRSGSVVRNGPRGEGVPPESGAVEAKNRAVQDHRCLGL